MKRTPVTSSQIASVGHNAIDALEVEFKGKTPEVYLYKGVPEGVYAKLLEADADPEQSVGSVFHALVKAPRLPDGGLLYPHSKVEAE